MSEESHGMSSKELFLLEEAGISLPLEKIQKVLEAYPGAVLEQIYTQEDQ